MLVDDVFSCNSRETEDTTPSDEFGLDAVIILELTPHGTFTSETELEMITDVVTNCQGPDCWLVQLATSAMPCEMTVVTTAEAP